MGIWLSDGKTITHNTYEPIDKKELEAIRKELEDVRDYKYVGFEVKECKLYPHQEAFPKPMSDYNISTTVERINHDLVVPDSISFKVRKYRNLRANTLFIVLNALGYRKDPSIELSPFLMNGERQENLDYVDSIIGSVFSNSQYYDLFMQMNYPDLQFYVDKIFDNIELVRRETFDYQEVKDCYTTSSSPSHKAEWLEILNLNPLAECNHNINEFIKRVREKTRK